MTFLELNSHDYKGFSNEKFKIQVIDLGHLPKKFLIRSACSEDLGISSSLSKNLSALVVATDCVASALMRSSFLLVCSFAGELSKKSPYFF